MYAPKNLRFRRFRRGDEVTAIAFSGGGVRGASQVGALQALYEVGVTPQLVAGTSVGAVNAVHCALFPGQIEHLKEIWLSLRGKDVFPGGRLRLALNLARGGHVHSSDAWQAFLSKNLDGACFEDAKLPCAVVAVRLNDGQRVVFESGPILPALMASTAIPGIFPPYRIGDELFVDGGLLEYMPLPLLMERGATTIFGLDCSYVSPDFGATRAIIDRCSRIAMQSFVNSASSLSAKRGRRVHLLRPALPEIGIGRDFSRTGELIQLGYEHARDFLDVQGLARHPSEMHAS